MWRASGMCAMCNGSTTINRFPNVVEIFVMQYHCMIVLIIEIINVVLLKNTVCKKWKRTKNELSPLAVIKAWWWSHWKMWRKNSINAITTIFKNIFKFFWTEISFLKYSTLCRIKLRWWYAFEQKNWLKWLDCISAR